jgi:hypothetical protein
MLNVPAIINVQVAERMGSDFEEIALQSVLGRSQTAGVDEEFF